MPKPVTASPSLELNVTLTVWLAPTATETSEVFDVAVTVSSVPLRVAFAAHAADRSGAAAACRRCPCRRRYCRR